MTDQKRNPPMSIGFDILSQLVRGRGGAALPTTSRVWLANTITEAVNTARLEGLPPGETLESIAAWGEETFGPIKPARAVQRAMEEMRELEEKDCDDAEEAADVVICMLRYPGVVEAINRKMPKNRKRRWRLVGDGTGYHIKDGEVE